MKVLWLNDSLVLRAENNDERRALSVVYAALGPTETEEIPTDSDEGCEIKSSSAD